MQEGNTGKTGYCRFNAIAYNIQEEEFLSAIHYALSSCCHRFWGSAATRRRSELERSRLIPWIYSLIWYIV